MQSESKFESKFGSFIIAIDGGCISVSNASDPTDHIRHFDMLAEINLYIGAMFVLDVEVNLIYFSAIAILCSMDGIRFIE